LSNFPSIDPFEPVRLIPVNIPKPWGQEIWFTGMEARGESQVLVGTKAIPLSAYLAHNPGLLANHEPVLLLKVLDPKPEPVLGDLYFEVHEEKQEVYVVTHIDKKVWPDGVGGIRFGMNQDKRSGYADTHAFRSAYLDSVLTYESIRRQIDEQGQQLEEHVEVQAREHMNSFAKLRPLAVGDVVRVPTWTPHSLLAGVRVVEFQTPTYERYIISFAQQVLTQQHWDSAHAVARMHIDTPPPEQFENISPGVERIAAFDNFNVWRADLEQAGPLRLPEHIPYAVCMALDNNLRAGGLILDAEQACFIPCAAVPKTQLSGAGRVLIAAPRL
jgi:mannose-6-phosphate isomerase class I